MYERRLSSLNEWQQGIATWREKLVEMENSWFLTKWQDGHVGGQ